VQVEGVNGHHDSPGGRRDTINVVLTQDPSSNAGYKPFTGCSRSMVAPGEPDTMNVDFSIAAKLPPAT